MHIFLPSIGGEEDRAYKRYLTLLSCSTSFLRIFRDEFNGIHESCISVFNKKFLHVACCILNIYKIRCY